MKHDDDRVHDITVAIPAGEVMTYGQIAQATGLNPRHVGRIISRISDTIPWWRIVRADGTPPACHGGTATGILRQEHVPFTATKVDRRALPEPATRQCSAVLHQHQSTDGEHCDR